MTWERIARSQHGSISRPQLRDAGASDQVVDTLIEQGALHQLDIGVFRVRGAPDTYLSQVWAAVLATRGILGFATATHIWEMAPEPGRIDVIVARGRHITGRRGVRLHRIDLRAPHIAEFHGLPITTRRCTALDYLGRLRPHSARSFADRALQQGWIDREAIAVRLVNNPGRIGNPTLRQILTESATNAAAESERVLHGLLARAGIAGWTANYPLYVAGVQVAVLDVAIVARRVAIEVDGWAHHHDVERFQRDRSRQNAIVNAGWRVLRFTWADLVGRPEYVVLTIRFALGR